MLQGNDFDVAQFLKLFSIPYSTSKKKVVLLQLLLNHSTNYLLSASSFLALIVVDKHMRTITKLQDEV